MQIERLSWSVPCHCHISSAYPHSPCPCWHFSKTKVSFPFPAFDLRWKFRARPLTSLVLKFLSYPYLSKLHFCSVYCAPDIGHFDFSCVCVFIWYIFGKNQPRNYSGPFLLIYVRLMHCVYDCLASVYLVLHLYNKSLITEQQFAVWLCLLSAPCSRTTTPQRPYRAEIKQ
jgi:hypothetical protein